MPCQYHLEIELEKLHTTVSKILLTIADRDDRIATLTAQVHELTRESTVLRAELADYEVGMFVKRGEQFAFPFSDDGGP